MEKAGGPRYPRESVLLVYEFVSSPSRWHDKAEAPGSICRAVLGVFQGRGQAT